MQIQPLTGQILVLMLPPETKDGRFFIPERDPDSSSDPYRKKQARKGIVKAIGPWKKTKNGEAAFLPPFGIGATVVLSPYAGTKLNRNIGEHLSLVTIDEVLAVLTDG